MMIAAYLTCRIMLAQPRRHNHNSIAKLRPYGLNRCFHCCQEIWMRTKLSGVRCPVYTNPSLLPRGDVEIWSQLQLKPYF
jgi:hypothetical protein